MSFDLCNDLAVIRGQLDRAASDADVLIGIVDGVPDLTSPAFQNVHLSVEPSMVSIDEISPDLHGTEVCSLIIGKDPVAPGLAAGCAGLALPIFFGRSDDTTIPVASQVDVARALTIGVERGASIINISAGQRSSTPSAGRHLEDALARCHERRCLVIAAAGNDGCDCIQLPAAAPTVLAVGAMDGDGHPLDQSNWGEAYHRSGLLAPGANLLVSGQGGVLARRTGTSYAAAVVTGVAARLLSTARHTGYPLNALDVLPLLIDSAEPCDPDTEKDCARLLAGRLDVAAAIDLLHQRGKAMVNPSSLRSHQPKVLSIGERYPMVTDSSVSSVGAAGQGSASGVVPNETVLARDSIATRNATSDSAVRQQACACSVGQQPQLVYAIGALWFDFGSEARHDAIVQQMADPVAANTPSALFDFLSNSLPFASGITFILMQDQIPIYAVQPSGPFALDTYKAMLDALKAALQERGDDQRVAIPGYLSGTARLQNGMSLPVLYPDLRGMVRWKAEELITAAKSAAGASGVDDNVILNFLNRVYDDLRNLGVTPESRAINFAATNAYQIAEVFGDAVGRRLELYSIEVVKSPICRPESDCWDVHLTMFDPENERKAGRIYRYTVDVSEVLPVTVGRMRQWAVPLSGLAQLR